ncbi:protein-cysteine N-palmitoyltransferase Rasp isoform X3 [Schistocerca gregaria]|uniref:protein-cysteine N-palmitoyltransferase Rasp isoform X3 n=1 Tax=Schistocerca gregaria TaxID=7010 RepID=UPI00211DFE2D|nr:protein-cysteine N-palmitoyltransferase Rasp isoform X3 [Schistocerca gregaria]
MCADLNKVEILTYAVVWLSGILTAVYSVLLKREFIRKKSADIYFEPGWSIVSTEKDVTDFEWEIWLSFMALVSPWIVAHLIGSWLIRLTQNQAWLQISFSAEYLLHAALGWTHMRCLSFTLDKVNEVNYTADLRNCINLLGYCFYLPTLFMGPLILYEVFHEGVMSTVTLTGTHVMKLSLKILRFIFWLLVTDFSLHFLYFNALQQQPQIVRNIDWWSLCGLGYCMGQFFMNKYVVVYGLAGSIAEAEHILAPRPPKCIARVHLYSEMWRYFDHGLYLFLVKYIYIPCRGNDSSLIKKLGASFVCFIFIYLWHNTYDYVLIWSVLNFIGITVEGICRSVARSSTYQKLEEMLLSPRNSRRFKAALGSPLFIMSALSSFYFLGRMEIGNIFVRRIFTGWGLANITLLLFCYCGCQVSLELMKWDRRRKAIDHHI